MKDKKVKVGWVCPRCGMVNNPESKQCIKKCRVVITNSSLKRIPNIIEQGE
jgi:hypothetical protein